MYQNRFFNFYFKQSKLFFAIRLHKNINQIPVDVFHFFTQFFTAFLIYGPKKKKPPPSVKKIIFQKSQIVSKAITQDGLKKKALKKNCECQ